MKKRTLKVLLSAVIAVAVVMSMSLSALAATYTTTTRYISPETVRITSVANNVSKGEYVTHYVTDADNNIVYLNQETGAEDNDTITFQYETSAENISAQMKFGGVNDTASNKGDENYSDLGLEITVCINGAMEKIVVVPEQEEGIVLSRKIEIADIFDFTSAITSITFDGSEIESYAVGDTYVVLYTSVITRNGRLNIETKDQSDEFKIKYGTLTYDNANSVLSVLSKVTAPGGVTFGIAISDEEEITSEDIMSAISPESLDSTLPAGAVVKFNALGKGTTGNFGVEIQGINEYLDAGTYYVTAYAIKGDECKVNATTLLGKRKFVVE